MADYSRYKTETLEKMLDSAWEKYKTENEKSCDGWGAGMRKAHLRDYKGFERARNRYYEILAELRKRGNNND